MEIAALEALGFSKEEIIDKVVDRLIEDFFRGDDEESRSYSIRRELDARISEQVKVSVGALAEAHVLPNVTSYIENIVLQKTNQWGEKTGGSMTFIEYLISCAENYLTEKVSFDGKAKSEANGYSWNGTQTRITHMVNKHLHYNIEQAMTAAVASANNAIAAGIQETVKIKLAEISEKLKVSVAVK